jgi:hypothetical protein
MSDLSGITESGNALTVSVTGDYAVADLVALKAKTTGEVTLSADSTITGTYTAVNAAIDTSGINNFANANVTLTGSTTIAEANDMRSNVTAGTITATITETYTEDLIDDGASALTDSAANAYTVTVAGTTAATDDAAAVTSVAAANLDLIYATANVDINVTATELTGTIAQITAICYQ